jgi:hypothetical protein
MKDMVTLKKRMEAFGWCDPIDRIPCTCHLGEYGTRLIGVSVAEYHHASALMVKGALWRSKNSALSL